MNILDVKFPLAMLFAV